jgi:hypothetical protein
MVLPGFTLDGNVLTINADIKQESEQEGQVGGNYQQYGWTVILPREVDGNKVSSKYRNDILEVHMPLMPLPAEDKAARIQDDLVEVQAPEMRIYTEREGKQVENEGPASPGQ